MVTRRPAAATRTVDLLVDTLATYRIVRLVQDDTVWPVHDLREAILDRHGDHRATEILTCRHCLAVGVAGAVTVARLTAPRRWRRVGWALALAGAISAYTDWQDRAR